MHFASHVECTCASLLSDCKLANIVQEHGCIHNRFCAKHMELEN
jgi:hypothetical protein